MFKGVLTTFQSNKNTMEILLGNPSNYFNKHTLLLPFWKILILQSPQCHINHIYFVDLITTPLSVDENVAI